MTFSHSSTSLRHLFVVCVLLAMAAAVPLPARASERCFPETGFCIAEPIRAFWEQQGGLPVFGFPIAPLREELIEGRPTQVQWFERNRLELHPENPAPDRILLGRLGADRLAQQGRDWFGFPKSDPRPGCRTFAETGHNICGAFLVAWRARGLSVQGRPGGREAASLALFGLPLSDEQTETIAGHDYTVQWFERARFEFHPENAPPANVLFGLLGDEVLAGGEPAPSAGACGAVHEPISAAVHPGGCINQGEPLTIDIFGFQPHEPISAWLTAPGGNVVRQERRDDSGPNGALNGLPVDTSDLYPGLWFWVFQGVSSNHQAIIYFQVRGSGAQAPPPVIPNVKITWGEEQRISPRDVRSIFPWVVVDGNNKTHIVYSTEDGNLWYTNNVAGEFGSPQLVVRQIGANREPFYALALGPGNTLHLAYALVAVDHQIYYRQAILNGAQAEWSDPQRISDGAKPFAAHLTVDGNNTAHIVWIELNRGVYNVYYRARRADGSLSDTSAPLGDGIFQNRPQVAVTGDGKVHVVFQHERDIYYARLDGGGWVRQNLSHSSKTPSYNATIATDGAALYVAWDEAVNNHDIQFRRSTDGGQSWSDISALSESAAYASYPNLTYSAASRRVYIVWADGRDSRDKQPDIWFRAFDPGSVTLEKPQRLTSMRGRSILPVVAAGPGAIAVVWQDRTRPDWQILGMTGVLGSG